MKKAVIFGAGEYDGQLPAKDGAYIIAADAGLEKCLSADFVPDAAIGDFDSLGRIPDAANVTVLPVEKDVTDLDAAVSAALEKGAEEIHIYGGMGGRPDHTYANISLAARLSRKGVKAFLYGVGYTVTAVTDGELILTGEKGKTVSVFSFTDISTGVYEEGLKYSLENAVLTSDFALGVSNSFLSGRARISVEKGTLVVMTENS